MLIVMQKKGLVVFFLVILSAFDGNAFSIDEVKNSSQVPVIITFKDFLPPDQVMASVSMTPNLKTRFVNARNIHAFDNYDLEIKNTFRNFNMVAGIISKEGIEKLKENPDIESIEMDAEVKITLDVSAPLIGASKVNGLSLNGNLLRGNGVSVCVIDTGVDYLHPYLQNVIPGYDFINLDNDPMDDHGHGTMVAGIIASSNSRYRGVAPEANIVALKALDSSGSGSFSDVIASIDYCITNKDLFNISVISMSLGVDGFHTNNPADCDSLATAKAISAAVQKGISVVVSSGNGGYSDGISYPACASDAISVGATNDNDDIASFSNSGSILDLLAPGVSIKSNYPGSNFASGSGTSFSAPHVSGSIAIIRQLDSLDQTIAITPSDIRNLLHSTGNPVFDERNGLSFPRLDIEKAVLSLADISPPPQNFSKIDIEIVSPSSPAFSTRSVPFHILLYESADSLSYRTNSQSSYTTICRYCGEFKDAFPFREGSNFVEIKAQKGQSASYGNLSFFIDSKMPKIHAATKGPRINGTFSVEYTEENLRNISLNFGGEVSTFACPSGKRASCKFSKDISSHDNKQVDYYFILSDIINTAKSDIYSAIVDTIPPSISISAPVINSNLLINVTTGEPARISYSLDGRKESMLCSKCTSIAKKKYVGKGSHSLKVYATDEAGNRDSKDVSFDAI